MITFIVLYFSNDNNNENNKTITFLLVHLSSMRLTVVSVSQLTCASPTIPFSASVYRSRRDEWEGGGRFEEMGGGGRFEEVGTGVAAVHA